MDRETFALLRLCRDVWERTSGVFDPTIGALMRAMGFRGEVSNLDAMANARASTGMELVDMDDAECRVRLLEPGVRLDLGAVGKGWALDRAAEALRGVGVENALIHGGTSSVIGLGMGPEGRAWRVVVGAEAGSPRVSLKDLAMGVSAQRGRQAIVDGRAVGHVIDPTEASTLGDESSAVDTAAVVHMSAAMSDALSTVLLLRPGMIGVFEGVSAAVKVCGREGARWHVHSPDRCVQSAELIHV